MPYMGELKQATAYTINVDNAQVTAKTTAITLTKINRREKVAAAETFSVAAGARTALADTLGPRIDRMIMSIHPPRNTQVLIEIVQGTTTFTETCSGDLDLVFDTVP